MPLHCVRRVLGLLPGLMVENTGMGTANAFRYQAGKEAKYSYWKPPRPIALVTTGRLPRHGQAADRRICRHSAFLTANRTKIGRKSDESRSNFNAKSFRPAARSASERGAPERKPGNFHGGQRLRGHVGVTTKHLQVRPVALRDDNHVYFHPLA